jgi:hypothetical protein
MVRPDPSPERAERAVRNQLLLRRLNEQVDRLDDSSTDEYACECGHASCVAALSLSAEEYDAIRRRPGWFVVLPGHWSARYERVVRGTPRYQVIEKIGADEIVERLDSGRIPALVSGRSSPG